MGKMAGQFRGACGNCGNCGEISSADPILITKIISISSTLEKSPRSPQLPQNESVPSQLPHNPIPIQAHIRQAKTVYPAVAPVLEQVTQASGCGLFPTSQVIDALTD